LGNCLPACPEGAISFEEREAAEYDEAAVKANITEKRGLPAGRGRPTGSGLKQWPVQIKLVSVKAPYFENARLLVSADCGAYAYGNFHRDFMQDSITLIGCPKLDQIDYSEKLTEILSGNTIKSVTVVRMEVPCCGGIENAVITALKNSGKMLPWRVVTLSIKGEIVPE
jgi:ferredoxin